MTYTVVLEPSGQGYRAVVPALPGCQADGLTREEAIANLRIAIGQRLKQVEITAITVEEAPENPWVRDAGLLADHPCWDDFQEGIALARAEAEGVERRISECTY